MCPQLVVCPKLKEKIDLFYEQNCLMKCFEMIFGCMCNGSESEVPFQHSVAICRKALRPGLSHPRCPVCFSFGASVHYGMLLEFPASGYYFTCLKIVSVLMAL